MPKEFAPYLELQIVMKSSPGFAVLRYPTTDRDALNKSLESKLIERKYDILKIGPDLNGSFCYVSREAFGSFNVLMPTPAMLAKQRAEWDHFNPPAVEPVASPRAADAPAGADAGSGSGAGGMASDPAPARPAFPKPVPTPKVDA